MSKATSLQSIFDKAEKVHGYPYPLFFTEIASLIAARYPEKARCMRPLVLIHVCVDDWQGHPLFKGMSRLYSTVITLADYNSGFTFDCDDGISIQSESWSMTLAEIRKFFVRGYHYSWGETTPFLSILNGGHSERICREILAVCPHHGPQGRGVWE